ncbi:MAG: undecaprenyl-diphosphatase UppP [Anaerolineae bacterium]
MTVIQALVLGLLQGATEFLPVSSSGHLVLVPWLLGWDAPGLTFDTTVHLGTLLAVGVYFRRDIRLMAQGVLDTVRRRNLQNPHGKLGWLIAAGSVPAALAGFFLQDFFAALFDAPALVSGLLLLTGLILFASERAARRRRELDGLGWRDGLLIGLAQAAAIAPGISRSGATIAAGLAVGLQRQAAARFSFLLALPVIIGAGVFQLQEVVRVGANGAQMLALAIGFAAAALSGYACIHFLLAYVRRRSLYLFAAYCWGFGVLCLIVALARG